MKDFSLRGMGVALITPFKEDKSVDFDALTRLLDFHLEAGTDYLVVLGTTAETPTLTCEERDAIVRFVVSYIQSKLPIIVGMGSNNTSALIEEITSFNFEGVHSILSVTPYYSKPTQEGLFQHYKALSEASPLPIVLYNVPGRTGVNMCAETTVRIAKACPNVIGIKEAHTDIQQVKQIVEQTPKGFAVVSGDDPMTVELIKQGGVGVISVLGNAFPKEFSAIINDALKGDFDKSDQAFEALNECCHLLFVDGNPAGVKCALQMMGYVQNELRLPLVSVSGKTEMALREELNRLISIKK